MCAQSRPTPEAPVLEPPAAGCLPCPDASTRPYDRPWSPRASANHVTRSRLAETCVLFHRLPHEASVVGNIQPVARPNRLWCTVGKAHERGRQSLRCRVVGRRGASRMSHAAPRRPSGFARCCRPKTREHVQRKRLASRCAASIVRDDVGCLRGRFCGEEVPEQREPALSIGLRSAHVAAL